MTIYPAIPEWRDGDLVSAAKLNAMIDLIDTATGLSEQRNYPFDAGANVLRCDVHGRPPEGYFSGAQVDYWVAHHGDQLVISFAGSTDAYFYWRKDESMLAYADAVLSPGTHTINLAGTQYGIADLYPYQPCRIILRSTQHPNATLFVNYVYQTDSNVPGSLGTMPAFTNLGTSSANDLNLIYSSTVKALDCFAQPVACQYSNDDRVGTRNYWRGYIQHRHKVLFVDLTITTSGWNTGDYFYIRYNGNHLWSWGPSAGNLNYDGVVQLDLDIPLTVGNWYQIEIGFNRTNEHEQHVTIWSMAEYPVTSTFNALTRWKHGDTLFGNGGGVPYLAQMSGVLGDLGSKLRWVNLPCRTAGSIILDVGGNNCSGAQLIDSMSSTRVHRWLAYNTFRQANGEWAQPQIQWASGNRTLQSFSLPQVEVPSFFDLESTPIKPGMWFRMSGVGFAIQTPVPGVNYA